MDDSKKIVVTITNRTIVRTIALVGLAVLAYKFIGEISHVLTLIFSAFFLSMALNPMVGWVKRRLRIKSRVKATAVSYLLVVLFISGFVALVVPPIVRQTRDFIKEIPQTVQQFQNSDSSLARAAKRYSLDDKLSEGANQFTSQYENFGSTLLNTGKRVAETIASLLAVLVLTFMMLVEGPRWLDLGLSTIASKNRARTKKLVGRMYRAVTGYVNGQVILAAIAGFCSFVALEIAARILNVDVNTIALAGIVAVFSIIPLFGNPIAATLVILACLLNSVTLAMVMLIYFIVYFFIENHTFQPYIQSRLNELTPLMVFIAALIGVGFGGILGAVVAIPAATTVKILLEDYLERHGRLPLANRGS